MGFEIIQEEGKKNLRQKETHRKSNAIISVTVYI